MRRACTGFASAVCCLLSFAVAAEPDDAVVVTATRFADAKRDLPVGVTVITADDLSKSASANLAEILAQFGLLHIRDSAGSPNQQLDLRGFGATGDQNTLVLLDGVRISENEQVPTQLSWIPIESIERIEVVRGGGAVLYGGGASGGTINIITRRAAPGEARAYALGRAGGYGTKEARAGYARQGEALGFSVAISDEDTNGYRRNNRFRQTNLAGGLEARWGDARGWLRFGADEQRLRLPGALTEAQILADRRQTRNPDDYSTRDGGHASAGGALKLGRHELSADLAWRDKRATAFFAAFGGFYTDTDSNAWTFTPRARLVFDAFGRSHDVVVGADFERWDYETRSAAGPAAIGSPFSHRLGEMTNRALYAQANLWAGAVTRLVLGGRAQRNEDRLAETVFPLDERRARRALESWELAARHGFGGGWRGYARYSRSFRVANFDDNACFFPPCASRLLEPQTARGSELGAEFEREGVRARAALYAQKLENEIYFSPLVFANINLSPTRRRGLELEAAWRAAPALELNAALALLDARFRSGIYGGVDVSGNRVPLVPQAIAAAGVSWRFAATSRANLSLRYVGRQRYDNDQANAFARLQPAYALVDAKLEHRVGRLELALEAKNLFGRKYYSYGVWDLGTSFSAFPAPGRALYLSVAVRPD